MLTRLCAAVLGFLAALAVAPGHAQTADSYPSRPIRILVGFAPGGGTDVIARTLAEGMRKHLNQSVLVENRPGANATLAAELVAKAQPDGYTLMVATVGALAISVHMEPKPKYETLRDFAPISLLVVNDGALIVSNDFPAKTLAEFIKLLKAQPGKYGYGVSDVGAPTHLAGESLKRTLGIDMFHVPFKGDANVVTAVAGGHIPIGVIAMAGAGASAVKAGTVHAVASLGPTRFKDFPNLPTVAESGYPGFSGGSWIGVLAPAGTPPAIVSRLNGVANAVLRDPAVIRLAEAAGSRPAPNSVEEFTKFIAAESKKWGDVIRDAGITAN